MSRNYLVKVALYFEIDAESEEKAIEIVSEDMSSSGPIPRSYDLVYEWAEPIIVAQEVFDNE